MARRARSGATVPPSVRRTDGVLRTGTVFAILGSKGTNATSARRDTTGRSAMSCATML